MIVDGVVLPHNPNMVKDDPRVQNTEIESDSEESEKENDEAEVKIEVCL